MAEKVLDIYNGQGKVSAAQWGKIKKQGITKVILRCGYTHWRKDFTMSVVMLLNVLDGNKDMAKPNGVTELIDMAIIGVDNYDDYMAYYNIIQSGEQFYDINDVTSCIKSLNPDASFDKMLSIYQERDISAIQARHASY